MKQEWDEIKKKSALLIEQIRCSMTTKNKEKKGNKNHANSYKANDR